MARSTNINVRVDTSFKEEIEAIAKDNYISPSELIRFSVETVIKTIKLNNTNT